MNKTKRFLGLFLIVFMLLAFVPMQALATDATEPANSEEIITISSLEDLASFRDDVNSGNTYEGKTVKLASDLDLSEVLDWVAIGNGSRSDSSYTGNAFKGVFDGGDYAISGLTITSGGSSAAIGLFGVVDGGTVKNLTLNNVSINASGNKNAGAAIGLMVNGATVDNITVSGAISAADGVGGVIGRMTISGTASNCVNNASVSGAAAGGIVGKAYYTGANVEMNIVNCTNNGVITGTAVGGAGGIVGFSASNVLNCINSGTITSSADGANLGGIVGWQQMYGEISGNANSGSVTSDYAVTTAGGIVGWANYQYATDGTAAEYPNYEIISVTNNTNTASIVAAKSTLGSGGIVGGAYNAIIVTNNKNSAKTISGSAFAAGILGNYQSNDANGYTGDARVLTVENNTTSTKADNIAANCVNAVCYDNVFYSTNDYTQTNTVATGTLTSAYTSESGYGGECGGNAKESFGFKLYYNDTFMGSTFLNNVGDIIDGDVYVSWNIKLDAASNTDEYWTMSWEIAPTIAMQPNRVEQWVDGVCVANVELEPNWADRVFPVVAAVTNADGKILSYVNNCNGATLAEAIAAANEGDEVVLLGDVTFAENEASIVINKAITIDGNGKQLTFDSATSAFVIQSSNVTIKNVTIVQGAKDNSFAISINKGAWDAPAIQYSNITISEVDFVGGDYALCLIGENVVVDGCTFTEQDSHNVIVYSLKGESAITDNVFNASNGNNKSAILWEGGADNATDLSGFIAGGKLTIDGNEANGKGVFFQFTNWTLVEGVELVITNNEIDAFTNKAIALYDMDGAITADGDEFKSVVISQNVFTNVPAGRPILKEYTGTVNVDASGNYLGSEAPDVGALLCGAKVSVDSYYADEALTVLVTINYVAQIGDVKYESLQEAVNVGGTVVLLDNVTLEETLTIAADKAVVLDLAGKTITAGWSDEAAGKHIYAITNNGTLVITGNGTINARGIFNYGNLTLESGTINAIDANGGYGVQCLNGATFTMNGGAINTTNEDGDAPGNGYDATTVQVENGATFIMNGGTINNISNFTVAIYNSGTTTIYDGTVTSVHTTVANYGTITINGGKFTCNGLEGVTAHAIWAASGKTTINGGTFDGKDNYNGFNVNASAGAVVDINGGNFLSVHSGSLYGDGTITVYGGTFFDDVAARCADSYAAIKNLDGNYVVGEKPTATVNNMGSMVIPGGEYGVWDGSSYTGTSTENMPLSFVMQFLADQTAEDMASSPYADWYADFVITFTGIENDSFTADGCYLAGYYGTFGWVKVPVDGMTIENGVRYPVMLGVGLGQKYDYVCSGVQDFKCALYLTPEILAANPNIQVNLELAVVDNSNGSDAALEALVDGETTYKVVDYDYDAEDFVVVAQVGNKTFATLQEAIDAANAGDTVVLLADIELDASIKITDGNVTLDLNGNKLTGPDVPATQSYYAFIVDGGSLTLKDSVGGGEIWAKCYGIETKSGSFTMESGIITATNNGLLGTAIVNYGGTVTINGGTLSGALGSVYTDGYFANAATTINGGTFNGYVTVEDSNQSYSETVTSASNDYTVHPDYKWVEQDGVYVLTVKEYVAEVGDVKYESLQDAIDAADGETVVLLADVELDASIKVEGNVTLDLAGHTITGTDNNTSGNFYLFDVIAGASFTVEDSVGEGAITLTATNERNWNSSSVVIANDRGTVTVNGGRIEHLGGTSMAYALDNLTNGANTVATMVVNGGTIDSTYFAIRQFANNGTNNLTINGGDIGYVWMQSPNINANVASTTVNGGTVDGICVTGKNAVYTLEALATSVGEVYGTAPVDQKFAEVDGYYVLVDCVYVAEVNGVKYESLQEAVNVGGEVVLLSNIVLEEAVTIVKDANVTIDLNGYSISQEQLQTGAYSMIVVNGSLTIDDTVGGGKISYSDTGVGGNYVSNTIVNNGTLTIKDGNIENNSSDDVVNNGYPHAIDTNGALVVEGGTIDGGNYTAIRVWLTEDDDTSVTVKDGVICGVNAIDMHNVNAKANKGTLTVEGGELSKIRFLAFGADVDEISINITDGTISEVVVRNFIDADDAVLATVYNVSGGTFSSPVDEAYCADGYVPCDNVDGTYGVKEVSNVEWYQVSMTYGSDLKMNFYLKTDSLVEGLNYYAKVTKTHADGCGTADYVTYISMSDWLTNGAYKQIVVDNIVAKEMNCTISMQIFVGEEPAEGEAESGVAVSNEVGTSVVNYALWLIRNYNGNNAAAVKTFAVDMLNYGATAQEFLHHYDEEHLANADLTEDEKALATQTIDTSKAQVSVAGDPTYAEKITAEFENTIYLNFYFNNLTAIEGYDKGLVTAFVEYVDHYGNTKTINYTNDMLVLSENGQQVKVSVQTLAPADANQVVNCVLYYDGEALTGISANLMSYCEWGLTSTDVAWATLCDTVIRYSQSAYNYFHANTISDNT